MNETLEFVGPIGFLMVFVATALATVLSTGLLVFIATHMVKKEIKAQTVAIEDNTKAVREYNDSQTQLVANVLQHANENHIGVGRVTKKGPTGLGGGNA